MTESTTDKKNCLIKQAVEDLEEINYMLKTVNLENLNDKELTEYRNAISNAWVIIAKIHRC